jgi:hypothetical protein
MHRPKERKLPKIMHIKVTIGGAAPAAATAASISRPQEEVGTRKLGGETSQPTVRWGFVRLLSKNGGLREKHNLLGTAATEPGCSGGATSPTDYGSSAEDGDGDGDGDGNGDHGNECDADSKAKRRKLDP